MKCDHKYEKLSTPYTEAKVYSEAVSEQQGGVYCDYDNTLCDENCFKHIEKKGITDGYIEN